MNWLLVGAVLLGSGIVVGLALQKWGMAPARHKRQRVDQLHRFLTTLLVYGQEGAVLHVEHEGSPRFLQFARHTGGDGSAILHFGFPDAPWSRQYIAAIREALRDAGFSVYERRTGENDVLGFVCVDLESAEEGARVAEIAVGAMELNSQAEFSVRLDGSIASARQDRDFKMAVRASRKPK